MLATKKYMDNKWLIPGKSASNPNCSITHRLNKHEKKLSNTALSPKVPIICIKNEWDERKGKTICSLDMSFFCNPHVFQDKGASKVEKDYRNSKEIYGCNFNVRTTHIFG